MPYTLSTEPAATSPGGNQLTAQEFYNVYDRPPAEMTALFARHGANVPFSVWLRGLGFSRGSDTPTTGHYELSWNVATITVNDIITASAGAGNAMVIELTAATDMYDAGATSGGSSIQASYPVKGDVFEHPDGTQIWVVSKDKTVNPHRLTIKPLDDSVDLDAVIMDNDELISLHNLWGEGDGLPEGRVPRIMKYTNTFALTKHAVHITGTELSNAVYHETSVGDPGSARQSIYQLLKMEDLERFERSRGYGLLLGKQTSGLSQLVTETNLDTDIPGTEGLVPFGLTYGFNDTYTVGSYAVTDFDTIADRVMDQRSLSTGQMYTLDGRDITFETENVMNTYFQNDLTPFINNIMDNTGGSLQGFQEILDQADGTVGLGYSVIRKGGIVFHMKKLDEFSDAKGGGHDDFEYKNYRVALPLGFTTDLKTDVARPMMGYEYKASGPYSREYVWGEIAGAGAGGNNSPFGQASHQYDNLTRFMISEYAGHWAVGNAIVVQSPA